MSESFFTLEEYAVFRAHTRHAEAFLAASAPRAVYARILRGTGCRTQTELAELLGISRAEIPRALRTERIPAEWHLRLCFQCFLSPYWLMTGKGEKYFQGKIPARGSVWGAALEQEMYNDLCLCRYLRDQCRCTVKAMAEIAVLETAPDPRP